MDVVNMGGRLSASVRRIPTRILSHTRSPTDFVRNEADTGVSSLCLLPVSPPCSALLTTLHSSFSSSYSPLACSTFVCEDAAVCCLCRCFSVMPLRLMPATHALYRRVSMLPQHKSERLNAMGA